MDNVLMYKLLSTIWIKIISRQLKDAAGRPTTLQNAGFASDALEVETLEIAPGDGTRWTDPDLPHQFESKSGIRANINWSG